jgi:hypothetical protein
MRIAYVICSLLLVISSAVQAADYKADLDKMLSADMQVSVPEVEIAITARDSDKLKITWLLGQSADARTKALGYFLARETENPETYKAALKQIASQVDDRIKEVEAARPPKP